MAKKILFIITQSEFGGAQRYVYEVAKYLTAQKYEILVATGGANGELFEKLKNTRVTPVYLKHMRRTPLPWQTILAIKEIYNLLKKEKPDILFLCSTTAGLLGSIASFFYKLQTTNYPAKFANAHRGAGKLQTTNHKLQTIYRIGGWAFNDPRPWWQNKIIFSMEKFFARFKDKIIVNSEFDFQTAIKRKIALPKKLVKIYNGIDIQQLEFIPKEEARTYLSRVTFGSATFEIVENFKIIGCVANFYKTKGLPYFIETAHILNTKYKIHLKFIIIGEGRQRPQLESLIKKYHLQNTVFLTGQIPDAFRYLKAFDIFVLPSLKEGFPWIILEAMAAELPIIAAKAGALPEIIEDKKNGLLIESKNPQMIAEKIIWLLKNSGSAKNMGIQAREKIKKEFTLEKMLQQTEQLL